MHDDPERHHVDCDYRNSMLARETEDTFDLPERTDVFGCTCDVGPEHTPGPWTVDSNWFGVTVNASDPSDGDYLFALCEMSSVGEQAEADARLIAAAPDLLAALRFAASWMGDHPLFVSELRRGEFLSLRDGLEAAIAKATESEAPTT